MDGIEPEELAAAGPVERVRAFVRAADAWLMAFARTAKYVPFGPERVFGCAVGLEAESYNFVLVLSGRANDIAPEMLRRLLRMPYV
jgi:vacuolar-type H+-ATPase subunit C/Vma6